MHAVIESTDNQFQQYWNKLVESDPLQNPLYAPPHSNTDADGRYQNHSFMVVREQEPVFGCSLTSITDTNGLRRLGFYGREASTLVNRNQLAMPSNHFEPEASRLLMDHFSQIMQDISPDILEYLDPVSCGLMSPLTQVLLEKGALPKVTNSQIIRLALSEAALLSRIDEQYRSQIEWGNEHIAMQVVEGESIEGATAELLELGKQYCATPNCSAEFTRSCKSLISARQGFLLQSELESRDRALFVHNGQTCHLVIADVPGQSASLPVIQTMLWQAIRLGKKLQCEFFDLGGKILSPEQIDLQKFGGATQARIRVSYSQ